MKNDKARTIRRPAAAGLFYPADPVLLRSMILEMLEGASRQVSGSIKSLIVPHAGYSYSGKTAACAYREIRQSSFKRVIVVAPSHRETFRGVSIFSGDIYQSPLGEIEVDRDYCELLEEKCAVARVSDKGHSVAPGSRFGEHALEVQLPFLQCALGEFKLVPLIMGQQDLGTAARLGLALAAIGDDEETLIVASSDLSHFHSYEKARSMDLRFLDALQQFDYFSLSHFLDAGEIEACGGGPVLAALIASENMGAEICELLEYKNSGDVDSATRGRVVGYASAMLVKNPEISTKSVTSLLTGDEKAFLLDLARISVESAVSGGENRILKELIPEKFLERGAVFVTLTEDGSLRGCIGSIIPHDMLYRAVASAAVSAALHDPRFRPVTTRDLPNLSYDISVLSRFKLVADIEEIIIGKHGLLIQSGYNKGLLLPQVAAEHSWDRSTFLQQTCIKASLPRDAWMDPSTDLFVFSASVFSSN